MNGLRYIGWALILVKGRGARVDQGAGLESLWLLWGRAGSNPAPGARDLNRGMLEL